MDRGSSVHVVSLHTKLRETFKNIQRLEKDWDETSRQMSSTLKSLCNLSEQLDCCRRVELKESPLACFPDIQEFLINKIQVVMESDLTLLNKAMLQLANIYRAIRSECESTYSYYMKSYGEMEMSTITQGTPFVPPLSEMLEWIDDIQSKYTTEYLRKKYAIERLTYYDSHTFLQLEREWSRALKENFMLEIWPMLYYFLTTTN